MTKKLRILSIDGGGIKGLIPAQILLSLEEMLKEKSGNPNAKIGDYFDLIAGTSTGGLLACLLLTPDDNNPNSPKYSAKDLVSLYKNEGQAIFAKSLTQNVTSMGGLFDEKYQAKALEQIIQKKVGDLRLSQLLKPCLITSYNMSTRETVFFTQHSAAQGRDHDFMVSTVARATSAAPVYFEAALGETVDGVQDAFIDGGVFANNPAMCAYVEASKLGQMNPANMMILSLGTGKFEKTYEHAEVKDWGVLSWAKPLLNILMASSAETVDYQLKQIFKAAQSKSHYLRIQPMISEESTAMDDVSSENMRQLVRTGLNAAKSTLPQLERFAEMLVGEEKTAVRPVYVPRMMLQSFPAYAS